MKLKKKICAVVFAFLLTFAIPYVGTKLFKRFNNSEIDVAFADSGRDVCIYKNNKYEIIDCEEYIVFALAGMYDETWNEEMTKVMAVVLRTAIYYEMDEQADTANGGGKIINESDLTEIRYEESELKEKWGNEYKKNVQIIYDCVADTAGQVIEYNDKLIIPIYHQVSVGATVSAEEMYGTAVPYLVSVDSSQDTNSPDFSSTKIYSGVRIKKEFGLNDSELEISSELTENYNDEIDATSEEAEADGAYTVDKLQTDEVYSADELQIIDATTSGFVKKVNVFGTVFSGEEFAEVLLLGTTNFHIDETDEGYRIISIGKGNSIGMSLYGAAYMAENGSTYEEIICYYYQGVNITSFTWQ